MLSWGVVGGSLTGPLIADLWDQGGGEVRTVVAVVSLILTIGVVWNVLLRWRLRTAMGRLLEDRPLEDAQPLRTSI